LRAVGAGAVAAQRRIAVEAGLGVAVGAGAAVVGDAVAVVVDAVAARLCRRRCAGRAGRRTPVDARRRGHRAGAGAAGERGQILVGLPVAIVVAAVAGLGGARVHGGVGVVAVRPRAAVAGAVAIAVRVVARAARPDAC